MKKVPRFSPGSYLQAEIDARDWALATVCSKTGLRYDVLTRLLAGQEPLTDAIAERLGKALGTSSALWRNLEHAYRARPRKGRAK